MSTDRPKRKRNSKRKAASAAAAAADDDPAREEDATDDDDVETVSKRPRRGGANGNRVNDLCVGLDGAVSVLATEEKEDATQIGYDDGDDDDDMVAPEPSNMLSLGRDALSMLKTTTKCSSFEAVGICFLWGYVRMYLYVGYVLMCLL